MPPKKGQNNAPAKQQPPTPASKSSSKDTKNTSSKSTPSTSSTTTIAKEEKPEEQQSTIPQEIPSGELFLEDDDRLFDFTGLDKIDPFPTLLKEPSLIAPYHRQIQDALVSYYDDRCNVTGGVKTVKITEDSLIKIENILQDGFATMFGAAIIRAYDELHKAHIEQQAQSTIRENSKRDKKQPQVVIPEIDPNSLGKCDGVMQRAIHAVLDKNPEYNENFFGSGKLYQNPTILPPIVQVMTSNTLKMDTIAIQPFLHLFTTFAPTSVDIMRSFTSTNNIDIHQDRPIIPGLNELPSNTNVRIINNTNYYLSQAILRQYPKLVTKVDSADLKKTTDYDILRQFLTDIGETDIKSLPQLPTPTTTQITHCLSTLQPIPDATHTSTHFIFYDYITSHYYNVTNSAFIPSKTQLMYAMVIGMPVEVINSLISLGLNINQTDENGWTALRWAIERVLYGRLHVYESFGLLNYLNPNNFNQTTPVPPREIRTGDQASISIAKIIAEAQPEAKTYDKYSFRLQPIEPYKDNKILPSQNPYFQQDVQLLLSYIELLNKYVVKHASQQYAIHQSMTTSSQLHLEDAIDTTPEPQSNTKSSKSDKNHMSTQQIINLVTKSPYKFTGAIYDETISENDDMMMVNAITAVYMIQDGKIVQEIIEKMGAQFSSTIHQNIQKRRSEWYTYPDIGIKLKSDYIEKIRVERERVKDLSTQLSNLQTEKADLQAKLAEYNVIEKNTTTQLAEKRHEYAKMVASCETVQKELTELQQQLQTAKGQLDGLRTSVKQQKAALDKKNDKKSTTTTTQPIQIQSTTVPRVVLQNDQYVTTLLPGVTELFTVDTAFPQQTKDLLTTLRAQRTFPDPLLDNYTPLPTDLDVSSSNPEPYNLFCTLYKHFVTEQPARIADHNDSQFATDHEAALRDHYQQTVHQYPSEIEFWKTMLANRAGLLHAAMIRMYQLEQLVRKYKARIYQLVDDIYALEGKYAIVKSIPKELQNKVQVQDTNNNKNGNKDSKKIPPNDGAIPLNFKNNMCIQCKKKHKEMITTCCFTMVTCQSCVNQIKKCPQCHHKNPTTKQVKLS